MVENAYKRARDNKGAAGRDRQSIKDFEKDLKKNLYAESALVMMAEIEEGTEFGTVLGNGVEVTGKALDVTRVPAHKGQAIPAHDPRISKSRKMER